MPEDTSTTTADTTATTTAGDTTDTSTTTDAAKSFTQEDVDRIVKERVTRERAKVADYADLKTKASRLDEIEAASASEQEKAVNAAKAEATKVERERTNTVLARAEARALAAEAQFQDPADAVAFLDLSQVAVNDDGEVDADEIKSQLKTLAEKKQYLLKPKPETTAGQAGIGVVGTQQFDDSPRGLIAAGLSKTTQHK